MKNLKHALEESHKDLHQWFLMHQECLLLGHDDYADLAFTAFSACLESHLQFENAYLLTQPLSGRWPLKVYLKEHEKLLKLLRKIAARLQSFYQLEGRIKRLALLEVIDEENVFLHVMEHHEQREEQDLFLQLHDEAALYQQWTLCEKKLQCLAEHKTVLKAYLAAA